MCLFVCDESQNFFLIWKITNRLSHKTKEMSGRGGRGGGRGGAPTTTTTSGGGGGFGGGFGGRGKSWVRGEPTNSTTMNSTSSKTKEENYNNNNNNYSLGGGGRGGGKKRGYNDNGGEYNHHNYNQRVKLSKNTYSRGGKDSLNANASSFTPSVSFAKEQERKKRELQQKLLLMERQKAELKAKVEEAARLAKLKEEQEEERVTKRFKEEQELKKEKAKRAGNLLSGFKDSLKNKGDVGNGGQDTADAKKTNAENETKKQIERVLQAGTDWAVLNLPRGSKKKWLTQSYRELARSLHPDKCALPRAKQAFQRVKEAYENLSKDAVE